MDGLLKKTMNYLNQEVIVQDEFVGKIVEVAAIKLKILRKIAEGIKNEKNQDTVRRKEKLSSFALLLARSCYHRFDVTHAYISRFLC